MIYPPRRIEMITKFNAVVVLSIFLTTLAGAGWHAGTITTALVSRRRGSSC